MRIFRHLAVFATTGTLMFGSTSWSREWTSTAGTTIEADLVRVHIDNAILKKADGKELVVPIAKLSAADQKYLAEQASSSSRTSSSDSALLKGLAGNLVKVAAGKVAKAELPNPGAIKYLALYFSAHWCGPCRAFTPDLVEFYKKTKPTHPEFELVFVSSDRSADEWENYMADEEMPWYSLQFKKTARSKLKEYGGPGIPCLVVVTPDGKVVSDSYVDGQYVGPRKVVADLKALLGKGSSIAESNVKELGTAKP